MQVRLSFTATGHIAQCKLLVAVQTLQLMDTLFHFTQQ